MIKFFVIYLILIISLFDFANAQIDTSFKIKKKVLTPKSTSGKDFWIAFLKNKAVNPDEQMMLRLIIFSEESNKVNITNDSLKLNKDYIIEANSFLEVNISHKFHLNGIEGIYNQAVHITAEKNISVIVVNSKCSSTDSYYAFSTESLGEKYRVITYGSGNNKTFRSQFCIIATEDSTIIEIIPNRNTYFLKKGKVNRILLNKGQVYLANSSTDNEQKLDLTGTEIISNKKIVLLAGHESAWVPESFGTSNFFWEQMVPDSSLGKYYIVPKFNHRRNYHLRILSTEDKNTIRVDTINIILTKNEYQDFIFDKDIEVFSSKPIQVTQFLSSFFRSTYDTVGDPTMITIVSPKLYQKKYFIKTPDNFDWHHITLIAKFTNKKTKILINGVAIDRNNFKQFNNTQYYIYRTKISEGFYKLESDEPFGLYSYGYDCSKSKEQTDAYAHIGGMNLASFNDAKDTIPPSAELISNIIDSNKKVILVISDKLDDDTGLKEIHNFGSFGLNFEQPDFEKGSKWLLIEIVPKDYNKNGKYIVEAIDLAGNKSYYTVCYSYDIDLKKFVFSLSKGRKASCLNTWEYQAGIFLSNNFNYHNLDFINSGELSSKGKFSSLFNVNQNVGLSFSKRFNTEFGLTSKVNLIKYKGDFESQDSAMFVRSVDGSLDFYQEQRIFNLNGYNLNFELTFDYFFDNSFYYNLGFIISSQLTKSIKAVRKLNFPLDYVYSNNKRETTESMPNHLSSLNNFRIGLTSAIGYNFTFQYRYIIFGELKYNHYFTSFINDGYWKLSQLSVLFGFKYNIK